MALNIYSESTITEAISTAVANLGYVQPKELQEHAIREGMMCLWAYRLEAGNPSAIVCYLKLSTCYERFIISPYLANRGRATSEEVTSQNVSLVPSPLASYDNKVRLACETSLIRSG